MCDKMEFPKTFKEFAEDYGFKDEKWAYTNGAELIPVFRVEQWLDHIETQINQLCSVELENGNSVKDEFIRKDYVLEIIDGKVNKVEIDV